MHIKNKRGQSTVEYILLMTAVVAVIIALVAGNKSQFQGTLSNTLNTAISDMGTGVDSLQAGHAPATAASTATGTPPYTVSVAP
jgi:Flp pilus assembly pilin Flp